MTKIDFQHMKIYTGVSHKTLHTCDARETFADLIYRNAGGIRAHALAMKIYKSEGKTEYSDDEIKLIQAVAKKMCLPGFIDGLNEQLTENTGG